MSFRRPLIIWGATGQAIVLEDFISSLNYQLIALFDNNRRVLSPFLDIDIYYKKNEFESWLIENTKTECEFLVAIGGGGGIDRVAISHYLIEHGLIPGSAIHPESYISKSAVLGVGCQVMTRAVVCSRVKVGDFCLINTSASIDHECQLEKGVHIGPSACLAGAVTVGEYSFIGAGATILPNIHIGKNTVIGAGSVVTKDVPDGVVYLGNPAKSIKCNRTDK